MYNGKRFKHDGFKRVADTHTLEFALDSYYYKEYTFLSEFDAERMCNEANAMQLSKERAEAKIRAMAL